MILESSKDIHVLATANNGQDAVDLYKKHSPDIALLDIRMKPMNGIETAKAILHFDAQAKILFLTTFLDDEYIIDALNLGAKGYILKQEYETIIPALNAIMSGQNVFGSEIVSKIPNLMNSSNSNISYTKYDITDKEFEIIELIASGLSNKEIANELNLSEGTVRNYLSIILEKLSLRDRTQLAIFYYKHQL
jgi:DNA-binding NarL/FixJ family response regulator